MNEEVLDLKELLDRVQDDKELLLELLDIYADDFRNKRKLFESAVRNKNCDELKNLAHSLKGASGNISAITLRGLFTTIEDMAKRNDLNNMDGMMNTVDKSFEQLLTRIESIKKELGGS